MTMKDLYEKGESPKKAVSLVCMDSTNLWLSVSEFYLEVQSMQSRKTVSCRRGTR